MVLLGNCSAPADPFCVEVGVASGARELLQPANTNSDETIQHRRARIAQRYLPSGCNCMTPLCQASRGWRPNPLSFGAVVDILTIDCQDCTMRATSACADCVVTFLCESSDHTAVVFDLAEQRAVRWFAQAGLVPTLRHHAAASTA